jgi:hypothetical protein
MDDEEPLGPTQRSFDHFWLIMTRGEACASIIAVDHLRAW